MNEKHINPDFLDKIKSEYYTYFHNRYKEQSEGGVDKNRNTPLIPTRPRKGNQSLKVSVSDVNGFGTKSEERILLVGNG